MDYRQESFRTKFADAARELGVAPSDIVSVKVREVVPSYGEYHELLSALEHDFAMPSFEIQGKFQGRAHLLRHRQAKVILVEHETGLEILSIAGSVASLITLIPMVLQAWRAIRGAFPRGHRHPDIQQLELRRFDDQGRLQEEHLHGGLPTPFPGFGAMELALEPLRQVIEVQVKELTEMIQSLTARVDAIEAHLATSTKKRKPTTPKKQAPAS